MLAGAKTVNPQATLTVTAVGDWGDVAAAKEAGLAQVDTAGLSGLGPRRADAGLHRNRQRKEGTPTGYVGDMAELGPDCARQHRLGHDGPSSTD